MGNDALITIVVPARNRQELLPRTLRSIAAQTLRPLDVILVDNGSSDSTREVMERWRSEVAGDINVEVIVHPVAGASGARNAGLDRVVTPWVMFFDSDDEMLPAHCADFAEAIAANPEADIVGRPVRAVALDGSVHLRKFEVADALYNHIFHGSLATQRFAVRTDFARRAGGWNVSALSWNDYEFGLRLLMCRPVMVKLGGRPTVIVHSQPDSITGTSFSRCPANWENTLELCRETLRRSGREDLLPWIDVRSVILAVHYRREGSKTDARRLLGQTLSRNRCCSGRLRMLYLQNLIVGHGTGRIARRIMGRVDGAVHPPRPGEPLMTIVIPARNRERLLPRTLASVRRQTLRPLSVVLVDNDSSDSTGEIMRRWQRQTAGDINVTVITEKRHSAAAARNAGLAIVTTPYVMFFDSDDVMLPCHCAEFADAIAANPGVGIFGRKINMFLLDKHWRRCYFINKHLMFNHLFRSCLSTVRYVAATALVRDAGGWNVRAWGWDDYELGIRILLKNPVTARLAGRSSVEVYIQSDSITGASFSNSPMKWEDTLDLCEDTLERAGRHGLVRWIHARRMILAAHYYREGARSEARRLIASTLSRSGAPLRMKLLMIHNRIFHRGTFILARILFPRTPLD